MKHKYLSTLGLLSVLIGIVAIQYLPNRKIPLAPPPPGRDNGITADSTDPNAPAKTSALTNGNSQVEQSHEQQIVPNPKWLDSIILRTLNTETTWNESGTEKIVVSIVEADFHHPYLRIEETYSVDLETGIETLLKYIPSSADTILVTLNENESPDSLLALESKFHFKALKPIHGTDIIPIKLTNLIQTDSIPSLLSSLISEADLIEFAEPDYLARAFRKIPNDELFSRQEGLHNIPSGAINRDIDAPEAWEIRTDASNIVVAVIDTGINLTHLDLRNNLWFNSKEILNGIDDDGNGIIDDIHGANFIVDTGDPSDDQGHGSMVAGVIGAEGNNGVGIAGVAWKVQLMAIKYLNHQGIGLFSDAIESIQYAIDQNVDVINNSWGGSGYSALLKKTIEKASEQGIIIVTAAGNDGHRLADIPTYPAAFEIANQVVVGASDYSDRQASFSNYDPTLVHIMAHEGSYGPWYEFDESYKYETGTSFSAPFVAGTFAILKAEFPNLSPESLIDRILDSVETRESLIDSCLSKGRLNLFRAIKGDSNIPINDAFSQAQVIEPIGGSYKASLTYASFEEFEPHAYPTNNPGTVWYRWTSPRSDVVNMRLEAPGYTGTLAAYTGNSLDQLVLIQNSRSATQGGAVVVEFGSAASTTYYIQVGRVTNSGGFFTFSIAQAPPNDQIGNATVLEDNSFSLEGSLALATQESGEPQIHPSGAGRTIWYTWTATKNGSYFIDVNSRLVPCTIYKFG